MLGHTLFFEGYDADPFNLNKPNVEQFCLFLLLLINWSVALFAISRGLMGLFYRYTSTESYLWRYVSDASYWIYLIHLVFALHLKDFSRPFNLPTVMDFGLTVVMTSLIGFVSYDLFIRSTWFGRFLNGRRYARFGWRLNGPGLTCIVLFFGGSLIPAVPSLKTERRWIERGESLSQIPFDLQSNYEKSLSMNTQNSEVNEKCKLLGRYAFCEMDADRETAQQLCHAMGARLPIFSHQVETEGVSKAGYGMHVWGSWLGITDAQTEGTWIDDEGRPITYENWHEGEPNDYGSGEDCAVFYSPGHWNDEGCTAKRNFICQFETRITPSERALCKDLIQRVNIWIKQGGEGGQNASIARSIKSQCSATHSIATTPQPLGAPIPALGGLWAPDLERIWQEPEFKTMASHHKTWAKGYLHVGGYRVIFGRKEIAFIYTRKTQDKRITIPYSIESNVDNTIVIKAAVNNEQKRYTLTIEDDRLIIVGDAVMWALKPQKSKE